MECHIELLESIIFVFISGSERDLSWIAMHSHPNTTKITTKPSSRATLHAHVALTIISAIANHFGTGSVNYSNQFCCFTTFESELRHTIHPVKQEGAREVAVQSCPHVENLSRPSATKGDAVKHDGGSTCLAELRVVMLRAGYVESIF